MYSNIWWVFFLKFNVLCFATSLAHLLEKGVRYLEKGKIITLCSFLTLRPPNLSFSSKLEFSFFWYRTFRSAIKIKSEILFYGGLRSFRLSWIVWFWLVKSIMSSGMLKKAFKAAIGADWEINLTTCHTFS